MIGKQRIGTVADTHETVKPAGIVDAFAFPAKICVKPVFVLVTLDVLGKRQRRNQP
jgi:hypothetical protein